MVDVTYQMVLSTLQTVGILFGIAYYIMTLNNTKKNQQMQLETRHAQLMMQLWNTYIDKYRASVITLRQIEYEDFDDFWSRYGYDVNPEFWTEELKIMGWFENIGLLVREGYLDIRLIALAYSTPIRDIWNKFEPIYAELGEKWDWPRLWSETEYLYSELVKYHKEHPELNYNR